MAETITITKNDNGTYQVTESENDANASDQPINQACQSLEEVMQVVQQALGDDEQTSNKAAWDQMAAEREAPQGAPA